MNTPKTFEPVVTDDMAAAGHDATRIDIAPKDCVPMIAAALAHPDFQRQLRAYAAEVARAMVPKAEVEVGRCDLAFGYNACRAATLSAIDEWEKNQ